MHTPRIWTFGGSLLVATLAGGPTACADIITLGPWKDNTLYEDPAGALSNGSGDFFFAGRNAMGLVRRGLLAFDIAATVPPGSTINSVSLTLHMTMTSSGSVPVALHRALADWGEGSSDAAGGEGGGAPAAPGDATWLHTFYDTDFWARAGGDFEAVASAVEMVVDVGFYTWSSPALAGDVQRFLDEPGRNYGWMLIGSEKTFPTTKKFDSRHAMDVSLRPMLTIDYTAVPAPAGLAVAALAAALTPRRRSRRAGHAAR